jgi:hypothetical protein
MQLHRTILSNVVQKRRKNKVALVLVNFVSLIETKNVLDQYEHEIISVS